jgi:hypothetical protein
VINDELWNLLRYLVGLAFLVVVNDEAEFTGGVLLAV